MPLGSYGVLAGRAVDRRREGATDTPHYQIRVDTADGTSFRIAVNVQSQESPSELLYAVNENFEHPVTDSLLGLGDGWRPLPPGPGGPNLDYVRGNLLDRTTLRALPPDVEGPDNDLADLLDHYVERAIADPTAEVYAFGERFGPETPPDKVFGFTPGNGVHDIHMNQGNSAAFARDDGVWQDGGLLLHFPTASRWVTIFLAFQSQSWHTDDATGHALDVAAPEAAARVRIVAALVNPVGPAPEHERVVLLNASPDAIDLTGWQLADRLKHKCPVPAGTLGAGETLAVGLPPTVQLGNDGGAVTLLDAAELKVDGVAYTGDQARVEGWTLVF
jgi:uncharacterized protein YukJ